MKFLQKFKVFENLNNPLDITLFLESINIPLEKRTAIIKWWSENRSHIKIHFFPFSSTQPIMGAFLGTDEIAINSKIPTPPHFKLFLSLHESRHCDQHSQGILMSNYYDTVVNNDKPGFLRGYSFLEKDANDFAINSMRTIGFSPEMDREEQRLRSNERAGEMVYQMMKMDIQRFQPSDFIDLLKIQIL